MAESNARLVQAELRAESAEEAKTELSLKLAEAPAQRVSAGNASAVPSLKAADEDSELEALQKR